MSKASEAARTAYQETIAADDRGYAAIQAAMSIPALCDEIEAAEAEVVKLRRENASLLVSLDNMTSGYEEIADERNKLNAVAEAAKHVASILRVKVARQEWATPTNLWALLADLETPLRAAGLLGEKCIEELEAEVVKLEHDNDYDDIKPHVCIWRNEPPINAP